MQRKFSHRDFKDLEHLNMSKIRKVAYRCQIVSYFINSIKETKI